MSATYLSRQLSAYVVHFGHFVADLFCVSRFSANFNSSIFFGWFLAVFDQKPFAARNLFFTFCSASFCAKSQILQNLLRKFYARKTELVQILNIYLFIFRTFYRVFRAVSHFSPFLFSFVPTFSPPFPLFSLLLFIII